MKTSLFSFASIIFVVFFSPLVLANPTKDYLKQLSKEGLFASEFKSFAKSVGLNLSQVSDLSINNTAKEICADIKVDDIEVIAGDTIFSIQSMFGDHPTEQELKNGLRLALFLLVRSTEVYCPDYTNMMKKIVL